jgi:hypothetical protein
MRVTLKLPELTKLLDGIDIGSNEEVEEIGDTFELSMGLRMSQRRNQQKKKILHQIPSLIMTPESTGFGHPSREPSRNQSLVLDVEIEQPERRNWS